MAHRKKSTAAFTLEPGGEGGARKVGANHDNKAFALHIVEKRFFHWQLGGPSYLKKKDAFRFSFMLRTRPSMGHSKNVQIKKAAALN